MRKIEFIGPNYIHHNDLPRGAAEWKDYVGYTVIMPNYMGTDNVKADGLWVSTVRHSVLAIEGVVLSAVDTGRYDENDADDVLVIIETKDRVFHIMNVSKVIGYIHELDSFVAQYGK